MSLGSILKAVGGWFAKIFKDIETDVIPVAVAVVQAVKNISDDGLLDTIDKLFGNIVPPSVLAAIKAEIPKILADLLSIEGLPADPTPDQIKSFADAIIASFASMDFQKKSEALTRLGVKITVLIQGLVASGQTKSFAAWATLLEESYQDYLESQNTDPNA